MPQNNPGMSKEGRALRHSVVPWDELCQYVGDTSGSHGERQRELAGTKHSTHLVTLESSLKGDLLWDLAFITTGSARSHVFMFV